jgi:DNA-entry nuclease
MNVDGMLPFENMVADYIKETDNHVMYRVTPVFEGENLVASGVLMEAESVEDHGEGVKFNVYVYNVQPGIAIDYATGKAVLSDADASAGTGKTSGNTEKKMYVLNENTKKFHTPECSGVKDIKERNKKTFTGSREELIKEGYIPCGRCKP